MSDQVITVRCGIFFGLVGEPRRLLSLEGANNLYLIGITW